MTDYEFHPIADLFPLIEGEQFDALCADVKKNGLRQNIMLFEGKILDGRNRYRACKAVGEELRTIEFLGSCPFEYVTAQNLLRRHINPQGRAFIAAQMANMKRGGDGSNQRSSKSANWRNSETSQSHGNSNEGEARANRSIELTQSASTQSVSTSQAQAADIMGVSLSAVKRAAQIIQKGAPELVAAVRSDTVSISAAAEVAMLPKQEQAEIIAMGQEAIKEAAKEVREFKKAESRNAEAWKPGMNGRVPNDRVNILLRHWQLATPFQRQRFIDHAVPSVGKEVSRVESREF